MYIVVHTEELRNASIESYVHKVLLIDGNYADPQTAVHLPNGSDKMDGLAARTSETRKSAYYERSGHQRSF